MTKSNLWKFTKAVIIMISVFASQQLITGAIMLYKNMALAITLAILGIVIYLGTLYVIKPFSRKNVKPWKITWNIPGEQSLKYILTVIVTYLMLFSANILTAVIKNLAHHTDTSANQDAINTMAQNGSMGLVVLMVLMAPFFEEIAFRWVIFEKMFETTKWYIPFAVSSIVFAGMHVIVGNVFNIWDWISYLPMAIIFAGLYAWRRNLILNITVHFVWNLTAALSMITLLTQ